MNTAKKESDASTVDSGWSCYDFHHAHAASPDRGCKAQAIVDTGLGEGTMTFRCRQPSQTGQPESTVKASRVICAASA